MNGYSVDVIIWDHTIILKISKQSFSIKVLSKTFTHNKYVTKF